MGPDLRCQSALQVSAAIVSSALNVRSGHEKPSPAPRRLRRNRQVRLATTDSDSRCPERRSLTIAHQW